MRLDWSIMGCTIRLRALINLGGVRGKKKKCEEVFRGPESREKKEGTAEGIHIRAVKAKGVGGDLSAPRTAPSPTTHQLFTCRMVSPVSWASCFFCSSEGYGCCSHQQESFGLPHCCPLPKV